jgi:hypothetical protein
MRSIVRPVKMVAEEASFSGRVNRKSHHGFVNLLDNDRKYKCNVHCPASISGRTESFSDPSAMAGDCGMRALLQWELPSIEYLDPSWLRELMDHWSGRCREVIDAWKLEPRSVTD